MKTSESHTKAVVAKKSLPFFVSNGGGGFFGPNHSGDHFFAGTTGKTVQTKPIFESKNEQREEQNIQRKCAACEQEENIQKKADGLSTEAVSSAMESRLDSSRGGGSPLPDNVRGQMEPSFDTDLSTVRVHNDGSAAEMNKELSAQAFTRGNDIYFGSGNYDPSGRNGQHLLAHELTHTVQQSKGIHLKPEAKQQPSTPKAKTPATPAGGKTVSTPKGGKTASQDHAKKKTPKPSVRAPGYDGTTSGTYISHIEVNIKFQGQSTMTLTWENMDKTLELDKTFKFPTRFLTTPGAGRCDRDCGNVEDSNRNDSECTPLGKHVVEGHALHLGEDESATFVTYFDIARQLGFHYYKTCPAFPASHACARIPHDGRGAEYIYYNVIAAKASEGKASEDATIVNVNASGNAKKVETCWLIKEKHRTRRDKYNAFPPLKKAQIWSEFALVHNEEGLPEADFYFQEAMQFANKLNAENINKLFAKTTTKDLNLFYNAAVNATGVGKDSMVATVLYQKLHPPKKEETKKK